MERWQTIEEVRAEAAICCRCDLCYSRTYVAFGSGPAPARLMIVGEGPGADEDRQARPFVGRAGKLLDELLLRAGLQREEIWVTNIVRCRPVQAEGDFLRNRAPRSDEIRACDLWMEQEYRFVSPEVVVCLGAPAAQTLISRGFRIGEGRGAWHEGRRGVPTTATYHPAYILRLRGEERRGVEGLTVDDLRMAAARLSGIRA